MATSTRFHVTTWTRVRRAWSDDPETARKGLRDLCHDYWPAIYGYLRRRGKPGDEALELSQEFIAVLLERGLSPLDEHSGRFRSYLIGALEKFIIGELRKQSAQKRGGDRRVELPVDPDEAEQAYLQVAAEGLDPEQFAMRVWALQVIEHANRRAQETWVAKGDDWKQRWEVLNVFLGQEATAGQYEWAADKLETTTRHVRVLVGRLRKLRRDLLGEELAGYVDGDAEAREAERAALLEALG